MERSRMKINRRNITALVAIVFSVARCLFRSRWHQWKKS
jgi:hypothetical protein